ncbi:hypothetical protein [Sandaracinobacteroides hominis]|uniref:hypothetical protein n=1 Tax=Sandaracinobacteroides hominis TaxID=2780086 RepID=UPI0018F61A51|nr:hypothetical protein [Sandaracinobacteroides hominis]
MADSKQTDTHKSGGKDAKGGSQSPAGKDTKNGDTKSGDTKSGSSSKAKTGSR